MKTSNIIKHIAPDLELDCWVQGHEPPLIELLGQAIFIEVIQVNCPGCFVHALPETIRLHEKYHDQGLKVFVIATAFEHFEHNTLNNLQRLLQDGELQGDPLTQLRNADFLEQDKLPYSIPFSVAMDKLVKNDTQVTDEAIEQFILNQIPDFHLGSLTDERKKSVYEQASNHLNNKTLSARTFEKYQLQGTPSSILIDKLGYLRQVSFGAVNTLEPSIQQMLEE